jgi:hypothetical protein
MCKSIREEPGEIKVVSENADIFRRNVEAPLHDSSSTNVNPARISQGLLTINRFEELASVCCECQLLRVDFNFLI